MRTLILFCFLAIGNALSAQLGLSIFGNLATPGHLLSKSSYPSLGGGGGMGALYRINFDPISIDAGLDGQFLLMGNKIYEFGEERDQFYNTVFSGSAYARIIFNQFIFKPYVGVFRGGLLTDVTEQYFMAGASAENKTQVSLANNSFSSIGFSFGFLYAIDPFIELEIGASYAKGSEGLSYFDFTTASADSEHVNYVINDAPNYDMWSFKLGLIFFVDKNNCTSGTSKSTYNNYNFNYNKPSTSNTATSHGRNNSHGKQSYAK